MQVLRQFFVRKFEERDLDVVCKISNESFSSPWSKETILKFYREDHSEFFVAQDRSEVVGYAMVAIEHRLRVFNFRIARVGHLLNFAVKRTRRRQGVGSALLSAVLEYLRREGVEEIFLEVNANNFEARTFYSRFGFEEVKVIKDFYFDGDAVVMARGI